MKTMLALLATLLAAVIMPANGTAAQSDKPNILIIWGDDIGWSNISAYHRGLMGGSTPNIDSIARDGMLFMDHYAEASCTAGRAAFITGQYPIRVGLATVGLPGAEQGMDVRDPTLATLLKPLGYATGQFGKNHLGDRDEHLPTNHGFDEFFGILYHLNAGEYVEQYDFPKDPEAVKKFAQRGVIHSWAMPDGTRVQQAMVTPLVTNLKLDPYERFHKARGFNEWQENRVWTYSAAFEQVGKFVESLQEYPPRMKSLDFDVDEALKALTPKVP